MHNGAMGGSAFPCFQNRGGVATRPSCRLPRVASCHLWFSLHGYKAGQRLLEKSNPFLFK